MKNLIEELTPQSYSEELEKRCKYLESVIKNKIISINKAPAGRIRCVNKKKHVEYYLIIKKYDKNGKYLPKAKNNIAKSIIQRDYDKKILRKLKWEYSLIKKLLHFYKLLSIENTYNSLSLNRKTCVIPVTQTSEGFIKKWNEIEYSHKSFSQEQTVCYSINGLQLRSKSEVIIANALEHYKIPFRYEFPLLLHNCQGADFELHPDFYCLNVRTRKEIIWEHFGLMDNQEYLENTLNKIRLYEENNFFTGDRFIYTMETNKLPLNVKEIEKKIKMYLI